MKKIKNRYTAGILSVVFCFCSLVLAVGFVVEMEHYGYILGAVSLCFSLVAMLLSRFQRRKCHLSFSEVFYYIGFVLFLFELVLFFVWIFLTAINA